MLVYPIQAVHASTHPAEQTDAPEEPEQDGAAEPPDSLQL